MLFLPDGTLYYNTIGELGVEINIFFFFNRELPDPGDQMGAQLLDHVNEPVPVHLSTHHGTVPPYQSLFNSYGMCYK
jgi:hypothetical protein